jgi:hypothetical protein
MRRNAPIGDYCFFSAEALEPAAPITSTGFTPNAPHALGHNGGRKGGLKYYPGVVGGFRAKRYALRVWCSTPG